MKAQRWFLEDSPHLRRSFGASHDRSGTRLFEDIFSANQPAIELFHRLSSKVDWTSLASAVEMRSMLRIGRDNFLSDIFLRVFTVDFQQVCLFECGAEDRCGFLLGGSQPV